MNSEDVTHLFLKCEKTASIWKLFLGHIPQVWASFQELYNVEMLLYSWPKLDMSEFCQRIWVILPYAFVWVIWCMRNDIIFNNADFHADKAAEAIKATVWSWLEISKESVHY
ncbi:hypothetical protein FRX31_022284, partial [Thalictrum thalictroides]